MKISIGFVLIFSFISMGIYPWSDRLESKVEKTIESVYPNQAYRIEAIVFDKLHEDNTALQLNDRFFRVRFTNDSMQKYIYVNQAASMKNVFDYAVLLSGDLQVEKVKVLIYREQHGRQIGSARWLKQFYNLKPDEEVALGKNVDGITGATISATSMTNSMNDLLLTCNYLLEKDLLHEG